jgi:secreted PhoX family phosphatase
MLDAAEDPVTNALHSSHFQEVLAEGLNSPVRRSILCGAVGLGTLTLTPLVPGAQAATTAPAATPASLGFEAAPKLITDEVMLPPGYRYQVVHATGDALNFQVPSFSALGLETDDFSQRIGDQHDGMAIFFMSEDGRLSQTDQGRALLCVNHESSSLAAFLNVKGQTSNGQSGQRIGGIGWDGGVRPLEEVLKEINIHGVSVSEIRRTETGWQLVRGSPWNRRITPETTARVAGPRAHLPEIQALFATKRFPKGDKSRGTIGNCGMGQTPWGTYLTCEENFYPYFVKTRGGLPDVKTSRASLRYGISMERVQSGARNRSQGWVSVRGTQDDSRFERWDTSIVGRGPQEDYRQEPNTFGYATEIDPFQRTSEIVKRTALGRFVHEAAVFSRPIKGQPLAVYMGCDGRNEYIYKFVSKAVWDPADIGGGLAAGDKYLNEGQLYAARFKADGRGEWLPLSITHPSIAKYADFTFANQAEVLVYARIAADALGATPMDRPEWGAVNPSNGEVYFSLTNNSDRLRRPDSTSPANPRAYQDADGKGYKGNPNGHIIRFREDQDQATARAFQWDVFLFGAEEDAGAINASKLTANNSFSSPDGIWFSKATGICWIETDDGAMTDESNCMLVAAVPGRVGDGGAIRLTNAMDGVEGTQTTFIGASLGEAQLKRFLTGPIGAEITGLCESADGKALFINIQHPGEGTKPADLLDENFQSRWPGNRGYGRPGRPRSATIVITREDGGLIGL